jgi:hypothetical protein
VLGAAAADRFPRYEWMMVPGLILAGLGLLFTFGGILYFAWLRLTQ